MDGIRRFALRLRLSVCCGIGYQIINTNIEKECFLSEDATLSRVKVSFAICGVSLDYKITIVSFEASNWMMNFSSVLEFLIQIIG